MRLKWGQHDNNHPTIFARGMATMSMYMCGNVLQHVFANDDKLLTQTNYKETRPYRILVHTCCDSLLHHVAALNTSITFET